MTVYYEKEDISTTVATVVYSKLDKFLKCDNWFKKFSYKTGNDKLPLGYKLIIEWNFAMSLLNNQYLWFKMLFYLNDILKLKLI